MNEVADYVKDVSKADIDVLVEEYYNKYDILLEGRDPEEFKRHVAVQAEIEIGFDWLCSVSWKRDMGLAQKVTGQQQWESKLSTLTKILPSAILRTSSDGMRLHSENNDGWM